MGKGEPLMSEPGPVKAVKATVTAVGEVVKIAADNPDARAAGGQLAKSALTVTKAINNALLPLAAVNFAIDKFRDYFETKFNSDLGEKLKNVPKESIVTPKASIAGPAMQGLAFSFEEPDLKELYLSLLASAMDGRVSGDAHPGFVEIIRQLTSEEARLLRMILRSEGPLPIVEIHLDLPKPEGYLTLLRHLLGMVDSTGNPIENPRLPAIVDNWIRLGLVVVAYDKRLVGDERYQWVESRPELVRLKTERETETTKVTFHHGALARTAFGLQFATAVGIVDRVIPT
jgi:hypothetical protein